MSFLWTSDSVGATPGQAPTMVLGSRIAVTVLFAIGLVYLYLIVRTFKKRILLEARDYDLESGFLKRSLSFDQVMKQPENYRDPPLHRPASPSPLPDVAELRDLSGN